jgi:hypothetical protein
MGDRITLAALLYPVALGISQESGEFYCSGRRLAKYFDCNPTTLYDAINLLEYLGFFEYVVTKVDGRKIYRVFTHAEWAKRNPGQCAIKTVMSEYFPVVFSQGDDSGHHGVDDSAHQGVDDSGH